LILEVARGAAVAEYRAIAEIALQRPETGPEHADADTGVGPYRRDIDPELGQVEIVEHVAE
jgi:hypothetical protein